MANDHHLKILSKGVSDWNAWRTNSPEVVPDLREADLSGFTFGHLEDRGMTFGLDLRNTRFDRSILRNCDLLGANL